MFFLLLPQLCGIVYVNTNVAETLLSLHVRAPLEACTYMGVDSAVKPIKNVCIFRNLVPFQIHVSFLHEHAQLQRAFPEYI